MKKLCHYISEYMGVLVLLSAIAALVLPGVFSQVKPTVINPLLGVIMFGMGLTLRADDFRIVFSRPKDVVIGCLAQFTVTPLLVLLLAGKTVDVDVAGMQNSGLASSLATLHFAAYPMATIPGAVFSVWHNISGAIVARIYNSSKT